MPTYRVSSGTGGPATDTTARTQAAANATRIAALDLSGALQDTLIEAVPTAVQIDTLKAQRAASAPEVETGFARQDDGSIAVTWTGGAATTLAAPTVAKAAGITIWDLNGEASIQNVRSLGFQGNVEVVDENSGDATIKIPDSGGGAGASLRYRKGHQYYEGDRIYEYAPNENAWGWWDAEADFISDPDAEFEGDNFTFIGTGIPEGGQNHIMNQDLTQRTFNGTSISKSISQMLTGSNVAYHFQPAFGTASLYGLTGGRMSRAISNVDQAEYTVLVDQTTSQDDPAINPAEWRRTALVPIGGGPDQLLGAWEGDFIALKDAYTTLTLSFDLTACDYVIFVLADGGVSPFTWTARVERRQWAINEDRLLLQRHDTGFISGKVSGVDPSAGEIQFKHNLLFVQRVIAAYGYVRGKI